jgi:hypothetical protein
MRQRARASLVKAACLGLALVMLPAGCAHLRVSTPVAIPSTVAAPPRTLSPDRIELGPKVATIGVAYPYDLYVHCGGALATFSGHEWVAYLPPGDPGPSPDADGMMTYTGYIAGWMTLLDSSTAIFTYSGSTTPVVYHETSATQPLCQ